MPGRITAELIRRGFDLADVAKRARCSKRYVQYVLTGGRSRFDKRRRARQRYRKTVKAQRVLRVVHRMLARTPTALTLRDLERTAARRRAA